MHRNNPSVTECQLVGANITHTVVCIDTDKGVGGSLGAVSHLVLEKQV